MTVPHKKPVTMPADLAGQTNGRLGPCNLGTIWAHGWGHLSAHHIAAEAWSLLQLVCEVETKVKLTTSSPADAYRTYEQQVSTFLARYTKVPLLGRPSKVWNGVRYWQKPGTAMAAVPGTSNHGWGLAFDTAIYNPGAQYPALGITSNPTVWRWLQANADSFGFTWEADSEPWHVRYYRGDKTPQRILDLRAWFAAQKAA